MSTLLAILILGCGNSSNQEVQQEIPVEVTLTQAYNQAYGFYYPKLLFTSIADSVTVDKVTVNNGNCEFQSNTDIVYIGGQIKSIPLLPRKLGYGEQFEVRLHKCNVLKVDVTTNMGDWTLNFRNKAN